MARGHIGPGGRLEPTAWRALGEVRGVGKATNSALAARARARQRAVAKGVEQAAREQRLSAAAAEVQRALAAIDAARARAALAIEAAQSSERAEVDVAQQLIDAAVRQAAGERLTIARLADLIGLPATDVRRILRDASSSDQESNEAPAAEVSQDRD